MFFARVYNCDLPHEQVRCIVDLGGNLGYSCLYWCNEYPNAKVLTFEPHPVHCRLLEWHVAQNGFGSRVQLVEAAVGTENGQARLEDADTASAIVSGDFGGSGGTTISVPVVDIFPVIPEGTIDVLKIDIEGSEYSMLMDNRFESLAQRTRTILLEWHASVDQGGTLCHGRLSSLGFNVKFVGYQDPERGMIYASRLSWV